MEADSAFTAKETSIVIANSAGKQDELEADEALSGEMTWSPDGQALLLAPWDADTSSTLVDLSGVEPVLSSVRFEFDASPPFISPPQWAPAVALPPDQNAALIPPAGRATAIVTIGPRTLPAERGGTKHAWEIVTRSPAETAAVGKALAGYLAGR